MSIESKGYYAYGVLYKSQRYIDWELSKGQNYSFYRNEWGRRPSEADPGDLPLNFNAEVTTRCNLACGFCTHKTLRKDQVSDLSLQLYRDVLSDAKNFNGIGVYAVNLNGLGEPLLRPDLTEFISYAKDLGVEDVMFHTNGTTLNPETIHRISTSGVDRIIVSVDSPIKETYESMRTLRSSYLASLKNPSIDLKGYSFDDLLSNVKELIDVCHSQAGFTPLVRTTTVLTDKTNNQLDIFYNLWKDRGSDMITYQDLTWRTKILSDKSWNNTESSAIPIDLDLIRQKAVDDREPFICPYLFQSIYLNNDGKAIPCSNPNAREYMIMGDFNQDSLSSIWNNEAYTDLRNLHLSGRWYEHPICSSCEVPLVEIYKRHNSVI